MIAKNWKQAQHTLTKGKIDKMWLKCTMNIAVQKNMRSDACYNPKQP